MTVSLPHLGVSVAPGGASLIPSTLDLAARGVTLLVGVSLPSAVVTPPPTFVTVFDFSQPSQSQYLILLAGFA